MSMMRDTVSAPASGTSRFTGILISFITAIVVFAVGQVIVSHIKERGERRRRASDARAPSARDAASDATGRACRRTSGRQSTGAAGERRARGE